MCGTIYQETLMKGKFSQTKTVKQVPWPMLLMLEVFYCLEHFVKLYFIKYIVS